MERVITYPKIECPHCHCSYTFDKDDIKQTEDYKKVDPDTGRSIYERKFYVTCPICESTYVIKSELFKKYTW